MQKRSESYSERCLMAKINVKMDISVLVDKIWGLVDKMVTLVDKVGGLVDISSCLVDKTSILVDIPWLVVKMWNLVDIFFYLVDKMDILVDIPWLVDKNPYVVENLQVSGHFPCGPILIPILVHIPFL